ncbi:hypothetical protein FJT64_011423 [Amphibalanus amphitrite]|uniref:BTB domain-containing protein n=1 Tax=Amphibalanus amphitrite TaxID=1232801 RepID=A0A6A4VB51_AMPAM|nr:hypothetical protein FJT64_011423 [Amphibalanus amphitrite]
MALAVSASLRDEQERSRRLAEAQLLELGLEGELEAVRDSGGAVPPEPTAPAPANDDPPAGRSRGRGGRRKGPAATSVLVTQTKEERDRRLCEKVAELLAWEEAIPVEPRRLRARKGSPQPAVAWEKAAQLHSSEPPEEEPDDDGDEDMDTTGAGDALGATQAALLLLAGDADDSESSQPPADSAEPPTSPGDSGDPGDLGVTAESAGVIPEGETMPRDEEGSGVEKDADSNDVAKMDIVMENPAKTKGKKGKEQDGGCFLAPAGDLGAALLELLLTDRGPPAETLLCRDGSIPVHAAVMAVRCPPLYRELSEAGGRLSLPVSHRAAAALVRLLYLGEIVFAGGSTPLPQLLLLAERFELLELAYYLRRDHGVTMPEPVKEAELVKVTERPFGPSSPAPAEISIDRPPLSPELFDLTASDGAEDMEQDSPSPSAASGSDRRPSPHRDSDSDVVCSPNQSPRRVGANTGLQSPYKRASGTASSGGTPRRRERMLSDRDKTPVRETGNPSPSRRLSSRDSNPATPSTPRRGQKRFGSPSRRSVSPDDICEVFSSLSKRRRTSSPATPSPVKVGLASPSTRRHQGEARFSRTPVGRRSSSNTPQKVGFQEPPQRPVSADSDIEILNEAPMVFTQKVKSPRRSSGLGEDGSPVKEAALESGDQGDQGGVSPSKAQTEASQAQSPVGGVSPLSSPSRSQPRKQTELRDDSFGSSPLISRRQEPAADSQSRPHRRRPLSDANRKRTELTRPSLPGVCRRSRTGPILAALRHRWPCRPAHRRYPLRPPGVPLTGPHPSPHRLRSVRSQKSRLLDHPVTGRVVPDPLHLLSLIHRQRTFGMVLRTVAISNSSNRRRHLWVLLSVLPLPHQLQPPVRSHRPGLAPPWITLSSGETPASWPVTPPRLRPRPRPTRDERTLGFALFTRRTLVILGFSRRDQTPQ